MVSPNILFEKINSKIKNILVYFDTFSGRLLLKFCFFPQGQ